MRGARRLARRADARLVSGGIGETEQQQLIARESDFNLKLVFTAERPSGAGGGQRRFGPRAADDRIARLLTGSPRQSWFMLRSCAARWRGG
jgi:hypothetical protein